MKGSCGSGFTLIELVIVLLVIGILGTIAYPTYIESVRKSKRASAKIALLEIANLQERFFIENNSYSDNLNTNSCQVAYPSVTPDTFYDLTITPVPNTTNLDGSGANCIVNTAATGYTVTATAIGTQVADTGCATFHLDSQNQKSSTGGGTNCW